LDQENKCDPRSHFREDFGRPRLNGSNKLAWMGFAIRHDLDLDLRGACLDYVELSDRDTLAAEVFQGHP